MKLIDYLNFLPVIERSEFAVSCGTTVGYLRKACSMGQLIGPETCVAIEQVSAGRVTRTELRPDDWARIWPELIEKAIA